MSIRPSSEGNCRPVLAEEAARGVLASSGAYTPGIDGIRKHAMESELPLQLESIRAELLAGMYQPQPAKRVYLPKADGKQRPLGVPTLRDRIVQRAMLITSRSAMQTFYFHLKILWWSLSSVVKILVGMI